MAEQGVFNPANSVPLGTPAQVASPPAVFDPSRSVPLGLPNEMIFNDQTGEVIEAPHGTTATLGEIFSRGLDKGDADTKISKLHFEQFMGNDTPAITAEIARLRKLSGPQIKTDGVLGEIFRATAQQLPVLKEIFGHAAERGAQGAIGGGMYGMAFAGVGSVPGFFAGLGAGALSGTIEGTFILETGETYAEISQFKHHDGSFVDPMAARIGAVAAGALSAGLEVMPMALLFRLVPGSKNVIGKLGDKALKALKIPTGKTAFRKFVLNISTIMAVETVTEGGQEEAKIIAGDLVKLTTDAATPLVTGNNALERVANAMEEALKATPLIATGFSTPKLGADILQQRAEAKLRPNTKEQKVEDMPNETVDSVTNKLKKAPVSADLKTYDVGELNETEIEELEAAGIEVADNGTIVAADAELIAAESQRRTDFYKKQEASQSKAANKEAEVVERQVSRARIRKIDEVVKGMDETIDATLETIDQLKAQDKPTKKLNNRVNKLLKQREILDEERASLLTTGTALGKAREALKATDKQVELKGAELIKAQRRTAKARVRAVQSSLNAALKLGRDNVKAAQSAVIDVINNSALPNDLKGKFLVAMRNVQTLEQLKKAVPRIQARIDKMVHKKRRGVVLKQLKKVIKSTKTKGTKGKFGAEVGDILNNVRKAFGLSDEAAQKILDVQSEAGTTEIPTPEQALENRILMLRADQKGTDLNQLESLLETLVALTELGKGIRKADILKKQEASAALRAELIDLMGPVRVETDAQRRRRLAAAKAEAVIFLGNSGAWWNKIKRIMRSSKAATLTRVKRTPSNASLNL